MPTNPTDLRDLSIGRLERTDIVIRQTFEKVTALFYKIHNLQLEIETLKQSVAKSNLLFLRLLDDPETREHAEAILKDFGCGETSTVKPTPK